MGRKINTFKDINNLSSKPSGFLALEIIMLRKSNE